MRSEFWNVTPPLAVFSGLALATMLVIYMQNFFALFAQAMKGMLLVWRRSAAGTAFVFDRLIPIEGRNGTTSVAHLTVWITTNLAVVAASIVLPLLNAAPLSVDIAAGMCAALAIVNVLFLSGTYWALREGEAVMNDEQNYNDSLFRDLSTAKNVAIFAAAAGVGVLQIAAVLTWVQEQAGLELVTFEQRTGVPYLDYLVFVVDAIPVASLYTQASGLSEFGAPAKGAGAWVSVAINSVASLLIVGGVVALLQRTSDLNGMIDRLVDRNDTEGTSVLGGRFKRAPAILKAYVRARFRNEDIESRKIAYLKLALLKPSFSFPASFIRDYRSLRPTLREEGTDLIEEFLADRNLDEEALADLLNAVQKAWNYVIHDNAKPEDRYRTGRILAAALGKAVRIARGKNDTEALERLRQQVKIKLVTAALREVIRKAPKDSPQHKRAEELLRHASLP